MRTANIGRTAVALRALPMVIILHACAPAAQSIYVAATAESVDLFVEPASVITSQYVMIENRSTEDIVVSGVQLKSCLNIRNECRTAPMRVIVRPRETRRLLEVKTANENQASEFAYSVFWEVGPVSIPIVP